MQIEFFFSRIILIVMNIVWVCVCIIQTNFCVIIIIRWKWEGIYVKQKLLPLIFKWVAYYVGTDMTHTDTNARAKRQHISLIFNSHWHCIQYIGVWCGFFLLFSPIFPLGINLYFHIAEWVYNYFIIFIFFRTPPCFCNDNTICNKIIKITQIKWKLS